MKNWRTENCRGVDGVHMYSDPSEDGTIDTTENGLGEQFNSFCGQLKTNAIQARKLRLYCNNWLIVWWKGIRMIGMRASEEKRNDDSYNV